MSLLILGFCFQLLVVSIQLCGAFLVRNCSHQSLIFPLPFAVTLLRWHKLPFVPIQAMLLWKPSLPSLSCTFKSCTWTSGGSFSWVWHLTLVVTHHLKSLPSLCFLWSVYLMLLWYFHFPYRTMCIFPKLSLLLTKLSSWQRQTENIKDPVLGFANFLFHRVIISYQHLLSLVNAEAS